MVHALLCENGIIRLKLFARLIRERIFYRIGTALYILDGNFLVLCDSGKALFLRICDDRSVLKAVLVGILILKTQ